MDLFNKKGIKEKEVTFEAGQDLIHTYFDSAGLKTKEGKMKDGKEEGMWSFFDEKGNKKRETEHKAGKEDGIYLIYYENGQKEATGPYTSEARIGKWTSGMTMVTSGKKVVI